MPADFIRVQYEGSPYEIPIRFIKEDHPGGAKVLLDRAGEDITTAFKDIGHSKVAKTMLSQWMVGGSAKSHNPTSDKVSSQPEQGGSPSCSSLLVGSVAVLIALGVYMVRCRKAN